VKQILKENEEEKFSEAEVLFDQANCIVCLEDFGTDDLVRVMPGCHHVFHSSCITEW
jgi:hypothetical protein